MAILRCCYVPHINMWWKSIMKTFIDTTNERFDAGDVGLSCKERKIKDNNVWHESPITKYEWSH